MLEFRRESLREIRDAAIELTRLADLHWQEIGHFNKTALPLAPDWDLFQLLEDTGKFVVYTARHDGRLVGYITFVVAPLTHYRNNRIAENTTVFLHPDFRRGFAGYRLVKFAVEDIKANLNVSVISLTEKAEHPFGPVAKRLGFELKEYKHYLELRS